MVKVVPASDGRGTFLAGAALAVPERLIVGQIAVTSTVMFEPKDEILFLEIDPPTHARLCEFPESTAAHISIRSFPRSLRRFFLLLFLVLFFSSFPFFRLAWKPDLLSARTSWRALKFPSTTNDDSLAFTVSASHPSTLAIAALIAFVQAPQQLWTPVSSIRDTLPLGISFNPGRITSSSLSVFP